MHTEHLCFTLICIKWRYFVQSNVTIYLDTHFFTLSMSLFTDFRSLDNSMWLIDIIYLVKCYILIYYSHTFDTSYCFTDHPAVRIPLTIQQPGYHDTNLSYTFPHQTLFQFARLTIGLMKLIVKSNSTLSDF